MNNDLILQEMIDNKESCRIIKNDTDYTVKLRPQTISESLKDKLSNEDIILGMSIVTKQIALSNIKTELYRQCCNTKCSYKNNCIFRAIPNGNNNAKVLFLNDRPTSYEVGNMCAQCDKNDVFLSLILNKLNVERESIYCTSLIKCNQDVDDNSYNDCINTFLKKEIDYIKPEIIICNGLLTLKKAKQAGIFQNLPSNITYGKMYTITASNTQVNVIAIYDIETVLSKTDEDYNKCKTELWMQLLSVFKSIE